MDILTIGGSGEVGGVCKVSPSSTDIYGFYLLTESFVAECSQIVKEIRKIYNETIKKFVVMEDVSFKWINSFANTLKYLQFSRTSFTAVRKVPDDDYPLSVSSWCNGLRGWLFRCNY